MSAHTKGPWAVREWSGGWTIYGGRLQLAAGIEIARIAPTDERERHEADARLIAAAPDLLAACVDLMRDAPVCEHDPVPIVCRYCHARAAIAKARGE